MIVKKICKLNNAVLFLKLFFIQSKKIQGKKFCNKDRENLKKGKVRFHVNIDVGKEQEDSWLNKIENNN